MSRRGVFGTAVVLLVLATVPAAPIRAQTPIGGEFDAPPAGDIIEPELNYAVGLGIAAFQWDDAAPYGDMALGSFTIERKLGGGIRGRAGLGAGMTDLETSAAGSAAAGLGETIDTDVYIVDLQVLAGPDFGPFREFGVRPYVLAGVGSLVTNPSSEGEADLTTRSQSQFTYGGGVTVEVLDRWEAKGEVSRSNFRLADPFEAEAQETETIHNLRWEGRLSWLF